MSNNDLVWLITGTSSGLGKEIALAALERGDKVIATARARSISQLDDLAAKGAKTIELDVTSPLEVLHEVAKRAISIYGRVDVLVNNAGYALGGTIEQNTPEETFNQFQTNLFGGINVARAFLPYMRERKTGTVIWSGSVLGWASIPYVGIYSASKWALRGISYTLHQEISPLGLRSICVDFGEFRTSVLNNRASPTVTIPDYQVLADAREAGLKARNGKQPGDPIKGANLVVDIIHGTGAAKDKSFPLSLAVGVDSYTVGKTTAEAELKTLEEWKEVSGSTNF